MSNNLIINSGVSINDGDINITGNEGTVTTEAIRVDNLDQNTLPVNTFNNTVENNAHTHTNGITPREEQNHQSPQLSLDQMAEMLISNAINTAEPPGLT
ncbi:hypothetical protein AVEN_252667-1 [Araneus ventricosus]|uniref:Uncharacterized protein n=1 Tax=Araneus ventricosus TaxID=182803 RepID=A0A4Y2S429_ARAVE|nr:hypothetical protein AVEN_252667-1 [Araneus ventricosus]